MNKIKQHTKRWLEQLTSKQIRALACQYRLDHPMIQDIETIKSELLSIPAVCEIAGTFDVKETI